MITKTGTYKTRCGEEARVLEIVDGWAIGYWGSYYPAKWGVITGDFIDGTIEFYLPDDLSLTVEKELKLFSEKNEHDNPEQSYLDIRRVDSNMIRLAFVDKDGNFKGAGHILSITPEGLARHTYMSCEFVDYMEIDENYRIKLIGEDDLC